MNAHKCSVILVFSHQERLLYPFVMFWLKGVKNAKNHYGGEERGLQTKRPPPEMGAAKMFGGIIPSSMIQVGSMLSGECQKIRFCRWFFCKIVHAQ